MTRPLKYVIIEHCGAPGPIVFPEFLDHREIAGNNKVSGAGFCKIDGNKVYVWGKSQSLQIESKQDDAILLKLMFKEDI